MSLRSLSPAYRVGVSLIFVAALALGVMAWTGLANHRELVWSKARDGATEVAERFKAQLDQRVRSVRFYSFPPQPGEVVFEASASLDELREQMNSDERTTAGLPLASLAAFEVARRTGSVRDGEQAYRLAMTRWPDLTSPVILKKLESLAEEHDWEGDFGNWKERWELDEEARDLIRELEGRGWMADGDRLIRLEETDTDEFSYLVADSESLLWSDGRVYGRSLECDGLVLGKAGEVVLEQPLGRAILKVGVLDPEALEAEWRSRRNGTFSILGFTILVIGGGVSIMTKGMVKEKKAVHARSQFVASVTHELRAPVGAIRLISDALHAGRLAPEKKKEFHRLLSRESGRLSVLIENVMELARVEDGQRAVRKETLSVPELAEEVCEMMAMQAQEHGVRIVTKGSPLEVTGDPVILRQILVNLLDNAIKFSPGGTTVTLSWQEGWSLTVADQGPGIPKEEREAIFRRFYRGEDELRRKTKGVGIGLSLVKELAELHGGSVAVSSQGGAVFKVSFPE